MSNKHFHDIGIYSVCFFILFSFFNTKARSECLVWTGEAQSFLEERDAVEVKRKFSFEWHKNVKRGERAHSRSTWLTTCDEN